MNQPFEAGSNFHRIVGDDNCIVMQTRNQTGDGTITIYEVMKGIHIAYNDFHMEEIKSEFSLQGDMFCVDHCREGRMEQELTPNLVSYLSEGDLRIDNRTKHDTDFYFPLAHYHGVSINFDVAQADASIAEMMSDFPVNIAKLREKFFAENGTFIVRNEQTIDHIFSELYTIPQKVRKHFLILKILELLLYLDTLELHPQAQERPYFYKSQTEKIKALHALITEDFSNHYTLDDLAKRFDMPLTVMKNCFKSIYGKPIYSYLVTYRMNKAASYLLTTSWEIAKIASEVGYDSPSRFSQSFKKELYMTPIEYRNIRKKNG